MDKKIYWGATILLTLMTLMGVGNYFFNYEMVSTVFSDLGYPIYLVYPLGGVKILAMIAIVTRKVELLKELAYAGLFFTFILGGLSHIMANEGSSMGALIALVLLITSYIFEKKAFQEKKELSS